VKLIHPFVLACLDVGDPSKQCVEMPVFWVIIDSVMWGIASLLNMNRKLFVEFLDPEIIVQYKAVGTLDDYWRATFPFNRLTWEARSDVQHDVAASPHNAIHFAGCR
jgi:hypothetical protein